MKVQCNVIADQVVTRCVFGFCRARNGYVLPYRNIFGPLLPFWGNFAGPFDLLSLFMDAPVPTCLVDRGRYWPVRPHGVTYQHASRRPAWTYSSLPWHEFASIQQRNNGRYTQRTVPAFQCPLPQGVLHRHPSTRYRQFPQMNDRAPVQTQMLVASQPCAGRITRQAKFSLTLTLAESLAQRCRASPDLPPP